MPLLGQEKIDGVAFAGDYTTVYEFTNSRNPAGNMLPGDLSLLEDEPEV